MYSFNRIIHIWYAIIASEQITCIQIADVDHLIMHSASKVKVDNLKINSISSVLHLYLQWPCIHDGLWTFAKIMIGVYEQYMHAWKENSLYLLLFSFVLVNILEGRCSINVHGWTILEILGFCSLLIDLCFYEFLFPMYRLVHESRNSSENELYTL